MWHLAVLANLVKDRGIHNPLAFGTCCVHSQIESFFQNFRPERRGIEGELEVGMPPASSLSPRKRRDDRLRSRNIESR